MKGLSLTVASWAERDDLVIEIDDGDDQVGLVTYDPLRGKPTIELYPRSTGAEWTFDLDELSAILNLARERILDVAGPEARAAMLAPHADSHAAAV